MGSLFVRKFFAVVSVPFFLVTLSAHAETPFNGVTQGAFAVSPTGAATYTIPIDVPPGIAGLQPELALSYNSQGGNGLLGMGWSLSGLSAITRCPKTYAQDDEKVGVKLDATDRYCLNGQRLVVVNELPYGTDGAEYRTEIDAFAKIISHGTSANGDGPVYFTVQTKAGRTIEFGNTPDSNINVTIQSNGQLRTLLWAANKISDTVGNELTISYIEETDIGHFRVSRIDYGNGNLSVRFEYPRDIGITLNREDIVSRYTRGAEYSIPTVLSNISLYMGNAVVRNYRLNYESGNSTGRTRLVDVTKCGTDGCRLPIVFNWTEGGQGGWENNSPPVPAITNNAAGNGAQDNGVRLIDLNGDGLQDMIQHVWWNSSNIQKGAWINTGDGWVSAPEFIPPPGIANNAAGDGAQDNGVRLVDLDGDGLLDLTQYVWWSSSNVQRGAWRNTGSGWESLPSRFVAPSAITNNAAGNGAQDNGVRLIDLNGDGLQDMIQHVWWNSSNIQKGAWINTGDGWVSAPEFIPPPGIANNAAGDGAQDNGVRLVDLDGDGLLDLTQYVWWSSSNVQRGAWRNTGSGWESLPSRFVAPSAITNNAAGNGAQDNGVRLIDLNGDGLQDMIQHVWWNSSNIQKGAWINTGDGWVSAPEFIPPPGIANNAAGNGAQDNGVRLVDLDGDGLLDLTQHVWWSSSNVQGGAWRNTGSGWESLPSRFVAPPGITNNAAGNGAQDNGVRLIDLNGDGLQDMIQHVWWHSSNIQKGAWVSVISKPDLLDSVSNNIGLITTAKYSSLLENEVYSSSFESQSYPVQNYNNATYVVQSVITPNGIGGQKTKTYHYEGAKVNLLGRGFFGFAKQTATTAVDGVVTGIVSTDFRQDYPYTGRVSHTETRLADGTLVGQSNYGYDYLGTIINDRGDGPISPYQTSSIKEKWEIDGSLIKSTATTTTLESTLYGDAIDRDTVQIDVKDASGVVTHRTKLVNDFASPNYYGDWLLGRIISSTITANNFVDPVATRETGFDYFKGSGLLKTETVEPGALANDVDSVYLKTEYTYDAYGHKHTVTVNGAASAKNLIATRTSTTTHDYTDPAYPQVTVSNHLSETEERIYDARWGKLVSVVGVDDKAYNRATTFAYNAFGRKNQESRIDDTETTWSRYWCDTASLITCETGEVYYQREESTGEAPITVFYDKLRRGVRRVSKGFNNITIGKDTHYDARGRVEQVSRNYILGSATRYWAVSTYDDLNRLKTITAPDNSITTTTYAGLITSITRQRIGTNGAVELISSQTKNPMGQVVKATDALLNDATYTYDPFGNPSVTTDSENNQISMMYDVRGRKKSMDDPDLGAWQYEYDAIGNLRKQTDAKSQSFVMSYDTLNRLTTRFDQSLGQTSHWAYYQITDALANRSVGQIKSVSRSADAYNETYLYDTRGRISSLITTLDGSPYVVDTDYYPNSSRVSDITYPQSGSPGRVKTRNVYDSLGNLSQVVDGNDTSPEPFAYWTAVIANADGKITWETLGNGLTTLRGFEASTGRLKSISTGASNNIQDLEYGFDSLGNLEYRTDHNQLLISTGVTEAFHYDDLNRLETVTRNGGAYQSISYDNLGNIRTKTGVGTYVYDGSNGAGPHAVSSIDGAALNYDANGNMVTGRGRSVDYTAFNKPSLISQAGGASIHFTYGPENARYKKVTTTSEGTSTQYNIGKLFERFTKTNGVVEYKNYIFAGGAMVAIDTRRSNDTQETDYVHTDHIGSTDVITNSSGVVKERHSYDPFGKYRIASWDDGAIAQLVSNITPRGFTGHEMLSEVGLIHMNGRVYDPELGRFVSADPFIQFPYYSQSLNRYSYVLNNPVSFVDPSGYRTVFDNAADSVRNELGNARDSFREWTYENPKTFKNLTVVAGIVSGCPTCAAAFYGSYQGYEAQRNGASATEALTYGVATGLHMYVTITTVSGGIDAFSVGAGNGLDYLVTTGYKTVMNRAVQRQVAPYFADRLGFSSVNEMNAVLLAISLLGDTRLSIEDGDYGEIYAEILGVGSRGVLGLPFDLADSLLSIQGLPTKAFFDYYFRAKGMLIVAHSLGTMDASNLVASGLAPAADLYALPLLNVAPANTQVFLHSDDPVSNGIPFVGSSLLNVHNSSVITTSFGISGGFWAPHEFCGGFGHCR